MMPWYLFVILSVLVILLGMLPLGAWVEYSGSGLLVRLKLSVLSFQIFPPKAGKKKEKRQGKKKKKSTESSPGKEEKEQRGGNLELLKESLPLVAEAAGGLRRKISIDDIQMDLLWGASDPADCAMGFGGVQGAIGMIWPLIAQNFRVKQYQIRTGMDFDRSKPTVYLRAQATIGLAQLLWLSIRLLTHFLKIYQRVKGKPRINMRKQ